MKNLSLNFALILMLGLLFIGCSKDNEFAHDVQTVQEISTTVEATDSEDTPQLMRIPMLNPCYPSPYEVLPNVNSQNHCELIYGCLWQNGTCYWCW